MKGDCSSSRALNSSAVMTMPLPLATAGPDFFGPGLQARAIEARATPVQVMRDMRGAPPVRRSHPAGRGAKKAQRGAGIKEGGGVARSGRGGAGGEAREHL